MTWNVLDLFSGIGGFALGLERAGMQTVAFCEIMPYPRAVLAKHWPEIPQYDDVRLLTGQRLAADGVSVDVICGGFPCQGISAAGKGKGLADSRSGLWSEYARIVREVRPRWVIVENSPALRTRGADTVLDDLEACGYACWPLVVGAAHAGAPHRRGRVFVVAYNGSEPTSAKSKCGRENSVISAWDGGKRIFSNATSKQHENCSHAVGRQSGAELFTDANRDDGNGRFSDVQMGRRGITSDACKAIYIKRDQWTVEPDVGRVAYGIPRRVDRLTGLGNAVVPQVAEAVGRAVISAALELGL